MQFVQVDEEAEFASSPRPIFAYRCSTCCRFLADSDAAWTSVSCTVDNVLAAGGRAPEAAFGGDLFRRFIAIRTNASTPIVASTPATTNPEAARGFDTKLDALPSASVGPFVRQKRNASAMTRPELELIVSRRIVGGSKKNTVCASAPTAATSSRR